MTSTMTRVRDFAPADYEAWVAASNRCYPDYPWTVKEMRHYDDAFDTKRFFKLRYLILGSSDSLLQFVRASLLLS